jgi:hypothetical protein
MTKPRIHFALVPVSLVTVVLLAAARGGTPSLSSLESITPLDLEPDPEQAEEPFAPSPSRTVGLDMNEKQI